MIIPAFPAAMSVPGRRHAYSPVSMEYREGVLVEAVGVSIGEADAVLGESVDIRGFHLRAVVAFQVSISQVIRVDEQYVWRSRCNVLSLLGFCDTGCKKRGTDPYDKC